MEPHEHEPVFEYYQKKKLVDTYTIGNLTLGQMHLELKKKGYDKYLFPEADEFIKEDCKD